MNFDFLSILIFLKAVANEQTFFGFLVFFHKSIDSSG